MKRWFGTLRSRLGRVVRRSYPVSKLWKILEAALFSLLDITFHANRTTTPCFYLLEKRVRSSTAKAVFAESAQTRAAGTANDAENLVGLDDLEWADIVLAMEKRHAKQLRNLF